MSSATPNNTFDVAVVGLGPVGSLGAILFAEAGLRVVALEKQTDVWPLPRAVNLDGEIIRALQPVGLARPVQQLMQPLRPGERAGFVNSRREWLFGGDARPIGSNGWQPANMFDQPELDAFLRKTARCHPNVTTYISHEVTRFSSGEEQVEIQAVGKDGEISLSASYLVACDGANSPTRKALGICWRDLGYDQDWLVVDVEMISSHGLPNEVMQVCDPDRLHTFVATKDPFRRWEFQLHAGETAEQMLDHDTVHALLDPWTPRDTYRLRRTAVYQFHAAVADKWQHHRIFLAGDSAHQTPPFLGQGMNSGMRDVINLAWKLPLVNSGCCAMELLETYQAERHDHAQDLVSWAVEMGHLMQHMADVEAAERLAIEPPQMERTSLKSGYGQGREQPPIRSGIVVTEQVSNEGATGYLLPQPVVRDGQGREMLFDELLGAKFALVCNGPHTFDEETTSVLRALEIQMVDVSKLEIVRGKFPACLEQGEALLLRPDRIVFGHTNADMSAKTLLARLADSLKFLG